MNSTLIENIKDKLDFKTLYNYYGIDHIEGQNYLLGECPFHSSQNKRDLIYYDGQKTCHCYGCEWWGDQLKFIQDKENISFVEAIKKACEMTGIDYYSDFTPEQADKYKKEQDKQKSAYNYLDKKVTEAQERLKNHPEIIEYCRNRGLTHESIKRFRLGYVDNWRSNQEMLEAGLAMKLKNGNTFVPYKTRIMIPYLDGMNRPYFAIFRSTENTPKARHGKEYRFKKLMSSGESLIKHKMLYYNHKKSKTLILAEGIFDALLPAQCGFSTASFVTTQPSAENVKELIPIAKNYEEVLIVFDNESNESGLKGAIKTSKLLLSNGIRNVKLFVIPKPEDVDKIDLNDYLKKMNLEKQTHTIKSMIKDSEDILSFICKNMKFDSASERMKSYEELSSLIGEYFFNEKKLWYEMVKDIASISKQNKKELMKILKPVKKVEPVEIILAPKEKDFMQSDELLTDLKCLCQKDIVGEDLAIEALLLASCGMKVKNSSRTSFNIMFSSKASAGKDFVVSKVIESAFPEERIFAYTRITPTVLNYFQAKTEDFTWDGKVLLLRDVSSSVLMSDVLKVFLSDGNKALVTIDGEAVELEVKGKPLVIMTSYLANPSLEMSARLFTINLDESHKQTMNILLRQADSAAGNGNNERDFELMRLLESLDEEEVVVPFAPNIVNCLKDPPLIMRRSFNRFLDFIKASAILHQKSRKKDKNGRLIASLKDYSTVVKVFSRIVSNGISLSVNQLRVFEHLLAAKMGVSIPVMEENLNLSYEGLKKILDSLMELGLIKLSFEEKQVGESLQTRRVKIFTAVDIMGVFPDSSELGFDEND